MIYRYAGAFLNENEFRDTLNDLPTTTGNRSMSCDRNLESGCAFLDGNQYLELRYRPGDLGSSTNEATFMLNFGICFAFYGGMIVINMLAYILPLPPFIKAKFREWTVQMMVAKLKIIFAKFG